MAQRDAASSADDRALLEACLEHDRDAWDAFVARFHRLIFSVVSATLKQHRADADADTVDDLFHGVFFALYSNNYRKLRQWTGGCSLASWIRLVSRTVVVDHLRAIRPTVPIDALLEGPDRPESEALAGWAHPGVARLESEERAYTVRAALEDLSAADRELLLALFRDDRAPSDVAASLGISPGALYTRKNRAMARLREAVLEHDPSLLRATPSEIAAGGPSVETKGSSQNHADRSGRR